MIGSRRVTLSSRDTWRELTDRTRVARARDRAPRRRARHRRLKDNFDIAIPGDGALICIKIRAKDRTDETALKGDLKGVNVGGSTIDPDSIDYTPVPGEDADGFNVWILKIEFGGGGGSAPATQTVHVGVELEDDAEWERLETSTEDLVTHDVAVLPSPPMARLVHDAALGVAVAVRNPSLTTPTRLETFEVAMDEADIALLDLNYSDPGVESLAWFSAIAVDLDLAPGETQLLDVPDVALSQTSISYWRSLYRDPAETLPPMGAVQSAPLRAHHIPLLPGPSLALLAVGLGAVLVWLRLLARQRRALS